MRRLAFILPVLAFLGIAGVLAFGLGRDPKILPSMLIGKPLPAFDLPDVRAGSGGKGLASRDFRGEPMLLNVFASWCVSCRVEHPFLMRLAREGAVPLHGLNWKDKGDAGARWLTQFGDPFDRVGYDPTGRTGVDLGVTGAPETFVIDAKGVVRYRHVGPVTPEVWTSKLEPLLRRLRAEP
ncbi:MAG TPA: DsbE family thiol:disulfide interchange protein [Caulobacter sp.]|nr:DsbE family thiol:disulfide interchange protein [Caulobacter sp.]